MHHGQYLKNRASRVGGRAAAIAGMATTALLLIGVSTSSRAQAPANMGLAWQDEFVGAATAAQPNPNTWNYQTGGGGYGNNELEVYTTNAANARSIWDGTGTDSQALQIEAYNSGGTWYSARIYTQGKQSFGPYGYHEARCKFPNAGDGYWPAFWMLGNNINSVGWPACGEIDIAEEINGQSTNNQSLHTGPTQANSWNPTLAYNPSSATTTYHNYGANWQPGYVAFYCDGNYEGQFNSSSAGGDWEFDNQTMYMLLNCAVGGNWPGNPDGSTQGAGYVDIDYVRQYGTNYQNFNYGCPENQTIFFTTPVDAAYGANGQYLYRDDATGNLTFSNSAWGGDPAPGIAKHGWYQNYTQCAVEGGSVFFGIPTNVAYGANGLYKFKFGVTGTITFNNATFGDPISGVAKAGYFH